MSHTTRLEQVRIRDEAAIAAAVERLKALGINCSLARNEKPRMFYKDQHGVCPFVLKLHDGPYDVGFDRDENGNYVPVYDNFLNKVGAILGNENAKTQGGKEIGKFLQVYAAAAVISEATKSGLLFEGMMQDEKTGALHLVMGDYR